MTPGERFTHSHQNSHFVSSGSKICSSRERCTAVGVAAAHKAARCRRDGNISSIRQKPASGTSVVDSDFYFGVQLWGAAGRSHTLSSHVWGGVCGCAPRLCVILRSDWWGRRRHLVSQASISTPVGVCVCDGGHGRGHHLVVEEWPAVVMEANAPLICFLISCGKSN